MIGRLLFLGRLIVALHVAAGAAAAQEGTKLTAEQRQALAAESKRLWREASLLDKEGKVKEAVTAGQKMLEADRKLLGDGHEDVTFDLGWLAERLEQLDDFTAAAAARAEVLRNQTRQFGKDDWRAIDARLALEYGELLSRLTAEQRGRLREARTLLARVAALYGKNAFAEALPLAAQALAIHQSILGEAHSEVATAANWAGLAGEQAGDYRRAKLHFARAAEIRKQALGEGHPTYATTLNNLASVCESMGEFARAEALYREASEIWKKSLGVTSAEYATSLNNLGELYRVIGDYPQAESHLQRAMEIRKKSLGETHPAYATSLNNLGLLYEGRANYDRAEPLFRQALEIKRKTLGEANPKFISSLNNLASLHTTMGDYAQAETEYRQALALRKASLGEKHRDYATSLHNLAYLYKSIGDYAQAEPLYRQAAEIKKEALGESHPEYATSLNKLAALYDERGDYVRAEPLYRQALEVTKKALGEAHEAYALSLNNLANLHGSAGDYARAEPLHRQALEIRKRALGETHPSYAESLNNLAAVYYRLGDYARAEPLYRQASEVWKKALGERHPDYAFSLSNLAAVYDSKADYSQAGSLHRQALEIRKEALGEKHPDYASSLSSLAGLQQSLGNYERAEQLYRQALAIYKQALGEAHPDYAQTLNSMGFLYKSIGDYARAEPLYRQALETSIKNLDLAAAIQSERQQLAMAETVRYQLHNYLVLATAAPEFRENAYRQLLACKGAVLARQKAMRAARDNPLLTPVYRELQRVTGQLARLSFARPPAGQQERWQSKAAKYSEEKERLEAQLAAMSSAYRAASAEVTLEGCRAALPEGGVLIDFLKSLADMTGERDGVPRPTSHEEGKGEQRRRIIEARYLAFVVSKRGPLELIVLGRPREIEAQLDLWRADFGRSSSSRAAAAWLREHLWRPIEEKLAAPRSGDKPTARLALISPDGALGKLPFGALPGKRAGAYLIEEMAMAVVPVPRAVGSLASEAMPHGDGERLLVLGGVDYDRRQVAEQGTTAAEQAKSGIPSEATAAKPLVQQAASGDDARSVPTAVGLARAPREETGKIFQGLAGAEAEMLAVAGLFQDSHGTVATKMQGPAATEAALARAQNYRYWHLATHGYFAAEQFTSAMSRTVNVSSQGALEFVSKQTISGYHPGLLSGLALAGANEPTEEDDGILTAEEVASLNLSKVDLVTLSACETGLGDTAGGEGLLGLQRAFQAAGARSVVASLWSVPDEATKMLMVRFYENLWKNKKENGEKYTKLEALREAQLWMLEHGLEQPGMRRDLEARGLKEVEEPGVGGREAGVGKRMPAYYWGAWVLSGEWR